MKKSLANPPRLADLPETQDTLGLGRLFRNGRALPEEDLPRLRWRLRASLRGRATRPRLVLKIALLVLVAFGMGGMVGAGMWPFRARQAPTVDARPPVPPNPRPMKRASRAARPALPPAPTPIPLEAPALDPAPAPVPAPPKPIPARAKRQAMAPTVTQELPGPIESPTPTPPAPSPIAVEQALLGQAMQVLRAGHDPRAALTLLDRHAEAFPRGELAAEATMLRIEALLTLGRRDEALEIMDPLPLASLPNRAEQLVVRGELRAARGRWREAERDFDKVLADDDARPATTAKARDLAERALWGRSAARSRQGDPTGARADLDRYLRRFPDGRFAPSATSLVKGTP